MAEHQQYDVIVAGCGSVGASACYHLAKRGVKVLGIERFEIPHNRGSHHGHSRMIRQAYYEHPDYVPLLLRAYELWDELQTISEEPFFHITGGLYMGAEEGSIFPGSLRAATDHGLEHTVLDGDEITERFPAVRPDPNHRGFHEERAGFLVPEEAVKAHADAAVALGANLHTGEMIRSWEEDGEGVSVVTDRASYRADQLLITAGAWSGEIAAALGIELEVTRQVLAWFEPLGDPARFAPGECPCWFVETDSPYGHYGFPVLPGDPGLKIALHKPGEKIDPARLKEDDQQPRTEEIDSYRAILDEYFPACAGELREACTCMYTNSPDGHFILGAHPDRERVHIACGLSGHGFKFASVLGEALADLAQDGKSELPIGFLSPRRFR